jgi:type III restriction enzyme
MSGKSLYQVIVEEFGLRAISNRKIPDSVLGNLNPKFAIRPYQQKALQLLNLFSEEFILRNTGTRQLLFHMATGSGKTLIMAGAMLDLYRQGFRNFLFFVDSTSIINKTRDNFLNKSSSKHLYASSPSIDGHPVTIQEVDNFQSSNPDAINIVFTTIQGLHSQINNPRENALTIDDFRAFDIVLISDEAHHINADTRQSRQALELDGLDKPSWENTVESIFSANPQNVLLEFTATMDFDNSGIAAKYLPRLIFDYPLKDFRMDGYSKEVTVLQSETDIMQRALAATILSQWRRKIFSDNHLSIKPVVLFKSRTIKESEAFHDEFSQKLRVLEGSDLEDLRNSSESSLLGAAFEYLQERGVSLDEFAQELVEDFAPAKQLVVNSKSATESNQLALNSLEDRDNEYRAIFAVDMLNEGWDVLNLFDIVRLYDTRDAKDNKVGKTTMSEAQLIGRGARYFPFVSAPDQDADKRKFDKDLSNPLRLCESLVYHSAYNPRYIQELNSALREIGLVANETLAKDMKLKDSFKKSPTYKAGLLFVNSLIQKDYSRVISLESYLASQTFTVQMKTGFTTASQVFEDAPAGVKRTRSSFQISLGQVNKHIIRKALNRISFYAFSNIKSYLPNLDSMDDFVSKTAYLGGVGVTVEGPHQSLDALTSDEQLQIVLDVCTEIENRMRSQKTDYVGSEEFKPVSLAEVLKDKVINITNDDAGNKELGRSMSTPGESALHLDLSTEEWFSHEDFYGTSEEKHLILFFKSLVPRLSEHFSDVHLIRNERFFKIYNFSDGAATEPDFFAMFQGKADNKTVSLQVFIEPKGDHLLAHDQWKENFLMEIKEKGRVTLLTQSEEFLVWGMPFYNKAAEAGFSSAFEDVFALMEDSRQRS